MCQKLLSRPKGQKVRPASQPDLRLAVVAVAPKSYFYPLQFKTSKKPRGCGCNEKHHCLPGPIRSKRAVLRASSAPRASDACVVFPDCRRECVKFDHRRSFAGKRSAGNPLVHRQKGTSPNDVAALERILNDNHFDFATADSNQFNQLSESQFAAHRLLIVPGGNFEDIGNGLTATTASN